MLLLHKFIIKVFKNLSNLTSSAIPKRFICFKYENDVHIYAKSVLLCTIHNLTLFLLLNV